MSPRKTSPSPTVIKRKGARSRADVTPEMLAAFHRGEVETLTLSEFLVVDFAKLLANVSKKAAKRAAEIDPKLGVVKRMELAGRILYEVAGMHEFETFRSHPSDIVRGWAAYMLAGHPYPLKDRLTHIAPHADDPHFGVREWAWMSARPFVAEKLKNALRLLKPWTKHKSANLRRFAIEVIRPRGVWCAHIEALKQEPEMALSLLESVRCDEAKYVQDSCANWLNDAGRTRPEFVRQLIAQWRALKLGAANERICKRAMRSLSP